MRDGDKIDPTKGPIEGSFEHECRIRNEYSERLSEFRPDEKLLKTEQKFEDSNVRADMWTVDRYQVRRVWEFKIEVRYEALGQILVYLALARKQHGFDSTIRGVLAGFSIQPEVAQAIEILNLGIELVEIPPKLSQAGGIPFPAAPAVAPSIPLAIPSNQTTESELS